VNVGPHVMSYHATAPYPGWAVLQPELNAAVDELFAKAPELKVQRLGLRYLNALTAQGHGIQTPADLSLTVNVSGDDQTARLNLNFITLVAPDTTCTVRIATKEFLQGILPPNTFVFVDVDAATNDQFTAHGAASVKQWLAFAHEKEKEEFFHLLKPETITKLAGH